MKLKKILLIIFIGIIFLFIIWVVFTYIFFVPPPNDYNGACYYIPDLANLSINITNTTQNQA